MSDYRYRTIHKLTATLTSGQLNSDRIFVATESLDGDSGKLSYNGKDFSDGEFPQALKTSVESYYTDPKNGARLPKGSTITLYTNKVKRGVLVVDIKYDYPDKTFKFLAWDTIRFYAETFGFKLPKQYGIGLLRDIFNPKVSLFYHPLVGDGVFFKYYCLKPKVESKNKIDKADDS